MAQTLIPKTQLDTTLLNTTSSAASFPTLNQSTTGSAATLTTARTIQTNLATTTAGSFNGSANITPGVTGTLPVANGGSGATTLTGLVKGNGTSAFTAAVSGTDYMPARTIQTLTVATNTYTVALPAVADTDALVTTAPTAAFTVTTSGTPVNGQRLFLQIISGTTGYAPTWNAIFASSGVATLPTAALPASKTVSFEFRYNSVAAKFILLAADITGY